MSKPLIYNEILNNIGKWQLNEFEYTEGIFIGALYIHLSTTECIEMITVGVSNKNNVDDARIDAFINACEFSNLI